MSDPFGKDYSSAGTGATLAIVGEQHSAAVPERAERVHLRQFEPEGGTATQDAEDSGGRSAESVQWADGMGAAISPATALNYGWSIIPTGLDKKPLIPTWKPYQTRQATDAEFRSWSGSHPASWAVVTGAISGRITLDFDGAPGRQTLEQLVLQPHRRTPSGGYHVDFRHPGWHVSTLNSKSKKELGARWPGLDIRADGGYVLFAGRTDQGEYRWLRDADVYELDILPRELREFLGLLNPPRLEPQKVNGGNRPRPVAAAGRVDAERMIRMALDRVGSEGRNNGGFWLTVQLRDNGYTEDEADGIMRNYVTRVRETNAKGQREAYTAMEAVASVHEAFKVPARDPWERKVSTVQSNFIDQPQGAQPPKTDRLSNWNAGLIQTQDGKPKAVLANAITALRQAPAWDGVLAFNEFSIATVTLRPAPWKGSVANAEWTDHEDRLAANWLQHAGILVSVEVAGQAVQVVARDQIFHPVREYLDSLEWDGTKRIDTWLSVYLGVEPSEYPAAVGARWLISAVARIYKRGCKADCCLILEGEQGTLKSTALKTLAGDWFTDELAELGSKDASLQTRGTWIIEIAELESMTRADVGKIKAFMSRATDRFRPPYGKRVIESMRQCVFAGSVNHSTYLRDETGSRRFWPVLCGQIGIDELAQDRDQLWAEALMRYRAGAPWWLDSVELNRVAEQEQAARYDGDPWDELIAEWVKHPTERLDQPGRPVAPFTSTSESVTISDTLHHCIGKCQDQWTQADKNRVARCLLALGWKRHRVRQPCKGWRYHPRPFPV